MMNKHTTRLKKCLFRPPVNDQYPATRPSALSMDVVAAGKWEDCVVTEAVIPVFGKGTQEGQKFHQLCIGRASLGCMVQSQRGRTSCVVDTFVIGALGR